MVNNAQLDQSDKRNGYFSMGSRVADYKARGTVRYIGPVADYDGVWLGIDWDDPSRGKHDGTYNGGRYFTASSPTSGSFVRPNKVQHGCSFLDAIREKYAAVGSNQMDVIQVGGTKTIEFVGMEEVYAKQSQLSRLREVILDDSLVSHSDEDPTVVTGSLRNVTELHMCHTLINDWEQVECICRYLSKLVYLNLSLNLFKPLDSSKIPRSLPNVRSLILTGCWLTWNEMNSLASIFPNILELGLCRNRISEVPAVSYEKIQSLDLEGNTIVNFSNISLLGRLSSLQTLNLSNTGLLDFQFHSGINEVSFGSLKTLYLCNNNLEKWQTINELNALPSLEHLLIHGNPLLNTMSAGTVRQCIISKIKNLKFLDRQEILKQERRGAEIDYLRICGKERKEMSGENFVKNHPRFDELCKIYGAPEEWEVSNTNTTGVLKNRILELLIDVPGREPQKRKVPGSITIQKLKALIGRICSVDLRRLQLSYESSSRPNVSIPLENDLRDLTFYSLASGDRVLVSILS